MGRSKRFVKVEIPAGVPDKTAKKVFGSLGIWLMLKHKEFFQEFVEWAVQHPIVQRLVDRAEDRMDIDDLQKWTNKQ